VFERFTDAGRRCVVLASEAARDLGHRSITVVHLFIGVTGVLDETGDDVLEARGVTVERLRPVVEEVVPRELAPRTGDQHLPFTAGAKKTLELSLREALERGDNDIQPRHILLAALDNPDDHLDAVLTAVGVSADSLRADADRGLPPAGPRGPFLSGTRHRLERIEALLTEVRAQLERIERRLDGP
jgi:ATP-dependent Clp protease ATP-binding subunit ClpA